MKLCHICGSSEKAFAIYLQLRNCTVFVTDIYVQFVSMHMFLSGFTRTNNTN